MYRFQPRPQGALQLPVLLLLEICYHIDKHVLAGWLMRGMWPSFLITLANSLLATRHVSDAILNHQLTADWPADHRCLRAQQSSAKLAQTRTAQPARRTGIYINSCFKPCKICYVHCSCKIFVVDRTPRCSNAPILREKSFTYSFIAAWPLKQPTGHHSLTQKLSLLPSHVILLSSLFIAQRGMCSLGLEYEVAIGILCTP